MSNSAIQSLFGKPLDSYFPKVDYGQGEGKAWVPATRAEVYQRAEKARADAAFANQFAADIILSKKGTGSTVYDLKGNAVKVNNSGYLHNKHSLNAAESWAGQAFGAPAVKGADGNWYTAYSQLNMVEEKRKSLQGGRESHYETIRSVYNPGGSSGYGFVQGERISDQNLLRQLESGSYAFSAKGANGLDVYVPFASGYELKKGEGGKPEAGNYKQDVAQGATARDKRSQWNVQPNVVGDPLGMRQTLLGGAMAEPKKSKTLLG